MLKRKKKRKKNKPIRRERERKKGGQFSFIYRNEVKNLMDSRSRGFIRGLDGRKLISREWIVLSFWNRSVRLTAFFFAVIIRLLHMRYHINTYLFLSFYLLLLLFFFFFFHIRYWRQCSIAHARICSTKILYNYSPLIFQRYFYHRWTIFPLS